MTFRLRLTLLYLAVATVAIVGLGAVAYVAARNATLDSVDHSLEADIRSVTSGFGHISIPLTQTDVDESKAALDRLAVEGLTFQIQDTAGRVLYSSAGGTTLAGTDTGPPEAVRRYIEIAGQEMRVLSEPLIRGGATVGFIETRTQLAQPRASIDAVRNVLIVGGAVAIALSGCVAFFVAGHASSPVRALSELAREIEHTADFTRRLPPQASSREMREMASTFNRMIGRVEDMIQAQRRFLSDTSHELRRPLTILRTDIDILTDPGLAYEDLVNVQDEMRVAAASMSGLLTELLILAREEEDVLIKEPVELTSLCRSIAQSAAALHPQHSYELHLPRPVWIEGDAPRLERMISNVILNAANYADEPGAIECHLTALGDTATLTIRDTGPGIAPDELTHVFERFFRGDSGRRARPEGTGLGLPIVRQIALAHGGDVSVVSQVGQGTTVSICLPQIPAPVESLQPATAN